MDLVQFLRDRLTETEAAVLRYRDGHEGPCGNFKGQDPKHYSEYDSCALHLEAAEATPYRDAAFGLADIEAKRQIVDAYQDVVAAFDDSGPAMASYDRLTGSVSSLRNALELLALPYANHEDYQQEWKP